MRILDNGVYRDMTEKEVEMYCKEEPAELEPAAPDALTEMVTAMSTATTIAQMRSAAKNFLEKTEV